MSESTANISSSSRASAQVPDDFSRGVERRLRRLRVVAHLCSFLGAALLGVVLALALCATLVPRLVGLQSYAIVSGSMEPTLPVGGLVYAEPFSAEELVPGDIAVFWRNGDVIIHRVEENDPEARELITRGDANDGVDAHPALYDNVIGRAMGCVPAIGYFILALGSLPGKFVLGWIVLMGAALTIIGTVISNLARH